MSDIDGVKPLNLLPDRLDVAEFSPFELKVVLGESADREQSRDNYNWVGAYLVEQAQLFEWEVAEWFKSGAKEIGGKRPLDLWHNMDGIEKVFDYAKLFKAQADEALADEPPVEGEEIVRSHEIANSALSTIHRSFVIADVELKAGSEATGTKSITIANPDIETAPYLRWKGNGVLEDYRITRKDGDRAAMYYITRYVGDDMPSFIMQSGIVESDKNHTIPTDSDSSLDGRPPSAGEIASFVIPLAQEAKNETLAVVA